MAARLYSSFFGSLVVLLFVMLVASSSACRVPAPTGPEDTHEAAQDGQADLTPEVPSEAPAEVQVEAAPEIKGEFPPETRPEPLPPPPVIDGGLVSIVHVTDGDTIYISTAPGARAHSTRLQGLNAPECFKEFSGSFQRCNKDDEYWGLASYQALRSLVSGVSGKFKVACTMKGSECEKDTFDRYLLHLDLPDGSDLGLRLLQAGGAWAFTRYFSDRMAEYCRAEAKAIKDKIGMWSLGRSHVQSLMSANTKDWYYDNNVARSHDGICSDLLKEPFAKLAGE